MDIAVWEKRGPSRSLGEENGITVIEGARRVMVSGGMRRRPLVAHLRKLGSELIHDNSIWRRCHIAMALAARQTQIPIVLSPHGSMLRWSLNTKRLKKRLGMMLYMRRILEQVAVFHATSEEEVECVRSAGFRQPIALIPHGIVLPDLSGQLSVDGLESGGDRTALFVSRLHYKKGLPMLIEAWNRLRPQGWKLLIVGPGEERYKRKLLTEIDRNDLSSVITIQDGVDHARVWELYREADLFILPTHAENFGLVVPEALAAGTPVITTKGAPWAELETNDCGWWVDIGVEPIRRALQEATTLPIEELRLKGERGRKLVSERYAWPVVARAMSDVYAWLLGKGSLPNTVVMD